MLTVSAVAGEKFRIQPIIKEVTSTSSSEFEITYNWKVAEAPKGDWKVFVHFTDEKGETKFQGDFEASPEVSAWQPGTVVQGPITVGIPDAITGTFDVRIGLYNDKCRAELLGQKDDQFRVIAGKIKVTDNKVELVSAAATAEEDKGAVAAEPSIKSVKSISANQFKIDFNWKVAKKPNENWTVFVHLLDDQGQAKLMGDHNPNPATSSWQVGDVADACLVGVPAGVSGTFDVRVGLYQDKVRAEVQGPVDDQKRIKVGKIKVADGQAELVTDK